MEYGEKKLATVIIGYLEAPTKNNFWSCNDIYANHIVARLCAINFLASHRSECCHPVIIESQHE